MSGQLSHSSSRQITMFSSRPDMMGAFGNSCPAYAKLKRRWDLWEPYFNILGIRDMHDEPRFGNAIAEEDEELEDAVPWRSDPPNSLSSHRLWVMPLLLGYSMAPKE